MSKETTSHSIRRCICDNIDEMDPIEYGSTMCDASESDGGNILSKSHFNEQIYGDIGFNLDDMEVEIPHSICEHDDCDEAAAGAIHSRHEESCESDDMRKCVKYMCRKHMPKATSDKIDDVYYCLRLPASQYVTCQADEHQ